MDVLAGYEPGDATWAPRPAEPYTLAMRRDPGRLKIAMTLDNALGVECDPEVVRGLHEAAGMLRELGHDVEEASPAQPGPDSLDIFIDVFGPQVSLGIAYGELLAGRPPHDDEIEPLSRAVMERARTLPATGYLTALAQLQALARNTVAFFADYDLLLTPVLAARPLPIGELNGCGDDPMDDLRRSGRFAPYTALFNVTGQPAITIPVGFGEDGLPTAVQLVGHPLGEETLLQVAARMEVARPWAAHRPAIAEPVWGSGRWLCGGGRRQTATSRRRATPAAAARGDAELDRVGGAAGRRHARRHAGGLVPRQQRRGSGERLVRAQDRPEDDRRDERHPPPGGERGEAAPRQLLRPGELVRQVIVRGAVERGQHARGDVVGPDRLDPRLAGAGEQRRVGARRARRSPTTGT